MLEHRIQTHFIESADLQYQAAEPLSKSIAAAIHAVLASVTSGGKVLACGSAGGVALAHYFAAQLVGRFERERPGLPALALDGDSTALVAAADNPHEAPQVLARQVRALGQAGDVLLVLCPDGNAPQALEAVAAAHGRDMTVVALSGKGGGRMGAALRETDVHIAVPHERLARIQEVHLLALHCICDGVDAQLLGEQEIPS